MARPRTGKILAQRKLLAPIERVAAGLGLKITIADSEGRVLWGDIPGQGRYPIRASGEIVGWVMSDGEAQVIAELLGLLAVSEVEKKELAREGVQKYREIALMYEVSEKLASCLRVEEIVGLMRGEVERVVRKGKPVVLILSEARDALIEQPPAADPRASLPASLHSFLLEHVTEGKAEIVNSVAEDPRFGGEKPSVSAFMATPLVARGNTIGVLLVCSEAQLEFRSEDLRLLSGLATLCASALEKARLYEKIEQEIRLRSNFQRYLSPTIVDDIIANRTEIVLGGKGLECSILFSDICGFTSMAERSAPEAVVELLNEYFSVMAEIIFRRGGTLDKFVGDAIMAVFGAPFPSIDAHRSAVLVALEMHEALIRLQWKWLGEGRPKLEHRVGINTGIVVAGNIGSQRRMDYTVIGDAVNLAARMEAIAPRMETLCSHHAYDKVRDDVVVLPMPPLQVKGREISVTPYRVVAARETSVPGARWITSTPVEIRCNGTEETSRSGVWAGVDQATLIVHTQVPLAGDVRLGMTGPAAAAGGLATIRANLIECESRTDGTGPTFYRNVLSIHAHDSPSKDRAGAGLIGSLLRLLQPGVQPVHA